jgi:hypothetical protein
MSQTSLNTVLLKIVIGLLSVNRIVCTNKPKPICEDNDPYIDAVLWNGEQYLLVRNQWIAYYKCDGGLCSFTEFHKELPSVSNNESIHFLKRKTCLFIKKKNINLCFTLKSHG